MAELRPGLYIIASALNENSFVGRKPHEDRSLRPKEIALLPNRDLARPWEVRPVNDGQYNLFADGAMAGVKDDKLFAFMMHEQNMPWRIIPNPTRGPGYFNIIGDNGKGWAAMDEEPFSQLEVRPIQPSHVAFPPALFKFIPIHEFEN